MMNTVESIVETIAFMIKSEEDGIKNPSCEIFCNWDKAYLDIRAFTNDRE